MRERMQGSELGFEWDKDAYEPIYGRDGDGNRVVIGVKRRPQDVIDRLRAERAASRNS